MTQRRNGNDLTAYAHTADDGPRERPSGHRMRPGTPRADRGVAVYGQLGGADDPRWDAANLCRVTDPDSISADALEI